MRKLLHFLLPAPVALLSVPTTAQTVGLYFPPTTGTVWATSTPASVGWCQPPLDSLLAYAGRQRTDALLILKDGRLVVERYYGTYTADSLHYWASAGKSLVASLVGLAQQDGILSLNDSTSRFLGRGWTSTAPAQERRITVRHQLTMTAGLDDTPPPCTAEDETPACLRYLASPATRWAYHNAPYTLLQNVLTRASGAAGITAYTRQRLGQRIGMSGLWLDNTFYSRARDMARYGLFVLARGRWSGTQILTDTAYFRAMTTSSQAINPSYGYLWWLNGRASYRLPVSQQNFPGPIIPAASADLIAALGKNDQKIYVVPSLGLVVVRQGESAGGGPPLQALSSFDNELWMRIMALYCRPTATAPAGVPAGFAAFPNPAAEVLRLRQPAGAAATVQVLDGLGREVRRQAATGAETSVSMAGLAPGLYLVQWCDAVGQVLARQRVAH